MGVFTVEHEQGGFADVLLAAAAPVKEHIPFPENEAVTLCLWHFVVAQRRQVNVAGPRDVNVGQNRDALGRVFQMRDGCLDAIADVGSIAFPYTHLGGPDYLIPLLAIGFPAILLETFVPAQDVEVLRRLGSGFEGHPNRLRLPGVELSSGSLGQVGTSC